MGKPTRYANLNVKREVYTLFVNKANTRIQFKVLDYFYDLIF